MLTSRIGVRHFGHIAVLYGLLALSEALCPIALRAADLLLPITGNLVGSVVDSEGIPQMGATVQLLNKYHQAIAKATSDVDGHFVFAALPADLYSLQASLASFLPVSRDKVAVKPGQDSVLQIHLATLFSSVEITYIVPAAAMTDDWKWVLRSSNATRPINRYLPVDLATDPDTQDSEGQDERLTARIPIFSGTHASLSLTGGDGGALDSDSSFSDFGTAFALSTQLYGKNRLQVSGSFGEDTTPGLPTVGLSATYSRNDTSLFGNPPEVTFTAIQIAGIGSLATGSAPSSTIPLRSMSLSVYEVLDPVANVHLEYGVTGESVDYVQHTSRISPFARMTLDSGKQGQWIASYSEGGRPDQLLRHASGMGGGDVTSANDDLAASSSSLQRLPQISSRGGQLVLQRTRSYEVGYNKVSGSRTYSVSGFSEDVNDGRLSVAGTFSPQITPDILSDTLSRTSVVNIGRYRRTGYVGSVDQSLNNMLKVGLAYGRMGGFAAQPAGLGDMGLGQTLATERLLRQRNSNIASANLRAEVPRIGTKIDADYGWIDSSTVVPRHIFTTQQASAAPGLNVYVRQPVPTFFGLPGRLELTADLRNLLAQGYLPLATAGGRQMLIVQAPQSVRGGLSFIF